MFIPAVGTRRFFPGSATAQKNLEKIVQTIGNSDKKAQPWTNGQFGYGIYSFMAACKSLDIISKYENLGFIVRCEIKRMKDFSFQGDINISSRVSNSLKKFQDSLIKQLGLVE